MKRMTTAWVLGLLLAACGSEGQGIDGVGAGGSAAGGAGTGGAAGGAGGGASGSGGAQPVKVGDPCVDAAVCPAGGSGTPVCLTDWPEGYCAVSGCEAHGHDCPDDPGLGGTETTGSKCVLTPEPTCLALCASTTDCRPGYSCELRADSAGHGDVLVCVPTGSSGSGGGMSSSGSGGGMMGGGMGM